MMQDLIDLDGEQMIDLRDALVDHGLGVPGDGHGAFEHLGDELLHQVLATLPGALVLAHPPFFDDLVEQTFFEHLLDYLRRCRRFLCLSHWNLPRACPFPSSACRVWPDRRRRRAAPPPACRCLPGWRGGCSAW